MSLDEYLYQSGFEEEEADRVMENMIRVGTIAAVDEKTARVTVQTEEILTDWLPWIAGKAGKSRKWFPPEVGEQVLILSPSGELAQGWVLPSGYKDELPPPPEAKANQDITLYEDGTTIIYDLELKKLRVYCVGDVEVEAVKNIKAQAGENVDVIAGTEINLQAPTINLTGAAAINIAAPTIGIAGSMELSGDGDWSGNVVHTGGSLSSNGVVLHTHRHGGVQTGGGQTGQPS